MGYVDIYISFVGPQQFSRNFFDVFCVTWLTVIPAHFELLICGMLWIHSAILGGIDAQTGYKLG